jgi:predicted  nucleic acid-binding Zn-ribbon protein
MTSAEINFVKYSGNRAYAQRNGSSILVGVGGNYDDYEPPPPEKTGLKQSNTLVMHENTSRESELFMLEEASIRIQRAYRMRKKRRIQLEHERSAVTRDDPDALIDADVFDAAYRGNTNALRVMLSRGASINAMGAYGQYPLHYAAAGCSLQCVELLLEHAASVNVQDAKGDTPLHVAARSGDIDLIRSLTRHRADRSARNYAGKTPRQIARRYGDDLAVHELSYTLVKASDISNKGDGAVMTLGGEANDNEIDEEDELTKISMKELDQLRKDLANWMQTAKRAKARERLAAKRAHNWEQQYHGEIDPLRQEVKRQGKEIEIYQADLAENYKLHQGAKDAINEAELAKNAMFLKKRQAEFDLTAVTQQMKDGERGIEYTRERMTNDMEAMEQERNRYRDEARQVSAQMEDYLGQIKKLEMKIKVEQQAQSDDKKNAVQAQSEIVTLQNRFDKVKDARERLGDRVKKLMDENIKLKNDAERREEELEMMRQMGGGGGGGGRGGRRGGGGGGGMFMRGLPDMDNWSNTNRTPSHKPRRPHHQHRGRRGGGFRRRAEDDIMMEEDEHDY